MTISYRYDEACNRVSYYNGSGYIARGTAGNNQDLLADNASTGHALYIEHYFKYGKINFNITTPLAGTGVTGVWEYGKWTGSWTWTALTNVVDDTQGLTQTGAKSVTFEIPDDWTNQAYVDLPYVFMVRYRITGGTISEGGKQSANNITCTVHGISSNAESSLTPNDLYTADIAGTVTLISRTGVSATDASPVINRDFLRLGERSVAGGAANDVSLVVSSFTGVTSVTVRLAGKDAAGSAQTEDITVTGNGTTYSTKYWTTLTSTQVTAVSGTGSFAYDLKTGRWGIMKKDSELSFQMAGNLTTSGTTVFKMIAGETLHFLRNWNVNMTTANVYGVAGSGANDGLRPTIQFDSYYSSYYAHGKFGSSSTTTYGLICVWNRVAGTTNNTGQSTSQGNLSSGATQVLMNAHFQNGRDMGASSSGGAVLRCTNYMGKVEAFVGLVAECRGWGAATGGSGPWNSSTWAKSYCRKCDTSGGTATDWDYLRDHDSDAKEFWIVDNTWYGGTPTAARVTWNNSGLGLTSNSRKAYEAYSLQVKLVDDSSNPISGAKLDIRQTDGITLALACSTNADGYFGDESGSATSGAANSITDGSKSWTTNDWHHREILITSGTGAGQRRYTTTNTGTVLTTAPAWNTNPASGSKFIILPDIAIRKFTCNNPSGAGVASVLTTLFPFTTRVRKYGYRTLKFTSDYNAPVVSTWALASDPFIALSESAAGALTGISVDHANQIITLSTSHTLSEVYDYLAANILSNMNYDDVLTTTDGINYACTYAMAIDGCTLSAPGKKLNLGAKVLTLLNSGSADFPIAYSSGSTRGIISVSSIVSGSRLRIQKASDKSLIVEASIAGTTYSSSYVHTADVQVELILRKGSAAPKYKPYKVPLTLTADGLTHTAAQIPA